MMPRATQRPARDFFGVVATGTSGDTATPPGASSTRCPHVMQNALSSAISLPHWMQNTFAPRCRRLSYEPLQSWQSSSVESKAEPYPLYVTSVMRCGLSGRSMRLGETQLTHWPCPTCWK